ncbi:hypothetical protein [Leptospira wolffii]|uniref:DUF7336 domain-containing protein n=1 Tax=Leptospira wolffii TaxID=409998 RepID=UPI00058F92C5|nr:hypothetical protein [Leptospira wolffii]
MVVFELLHYYERDDNEEDWKRLGVFSTEEKVEDAMNHYLNLPGFRDHQNGFHINRIEIDNLEWTSGFVRV